MSSVCVCVRARVRACVRAREGRVILILRFANSFVDYPMPRMVKGPEEERQKRGGGGGGGGGSCKRWGGDG